MKQDFYYLTAQEQRAQLEEIHEARQELYKFEIRMKLENLEMEVKYFPPTFLNLLDNKELIKKIEEGIKRATKEIQTIEELLK